ncbi:DUF4998 domain-containing protein [Parabacteroides caeci]|uniref:DUF4998 domain-containing protein n=1 Tax=Parabacteroides caeci TaxID=2949650 RepID=UPI00202F523F|nr:DUF4998 domain-containing protein [Parabacteroides sp. W1-Q-101]
MNDNIKEYLDRGEIAYIGKADSVTTAGGINRIKLLWKINSDPRITSCKILWNDKQDSVSFPIDRGEVDKNGYLSYILEDMPEGTFIFNLYHVGVDNSLSMGSEIEGTVYGDIYKSNLNPRKIRLVETLADKVNLYWEEGGNSSNVLFTYINRTGEKKTINIPASETVTVIDDYVLGGEYSYKTIFLPEENALDQFELDSPVDKFPTYYVGDGSLDDIFPEYLKLDRGTWKIDDFSSEEPTGANGRAAQIIDNDPSTFWHSEWQATTAQLPHSITIDMNTVKGVKCVTIAKRQGNTDLKTAHIEISTDNRSWEIAGKVEFEKTADPNAKTIVLGEIKKARYMKLVITESHRSPSASISEVYVLGTE